MMRSKREHLEMNRAAWEACHRGWFEASTNKPRYYAQYRNREHDFDQDELNMLGDVRGLDVLVLSCAGDASQVFSLRILSARKPE